MEPESYTPCPALQKRVETHFGVSIHPAEMAMIHKGHELAALLLAKIDAAKMGKHWPETKIWRDLQALLADEFGHWPEDVRMFHPIRRDEYLDAFE